MFKRLGLACMLICQTLPSEAGTFEQALAKLAPEERSHQACALKALPLLSRDPRLRRADSIKSSIFKPAVLNKTKLVAEGGAVRSGQRWFAISYSCDLTPDFMKAVSFTFTLGREIPKTEWERIGLWG